MGSNLGSNSTPELSKNAVACCVGNATPVVRNGLVEDCPPLREPLERPDLVSAHQAAVALDVGREDSNQPALGINRFRQNTPLDPVGSLPRD